jgi:hypothetical protein
MMSTPFPPNVRYEGDARLWRYFGPYLQDVTVRVRFHYRVPLMGGDVGNGWNYVFHGWITVPNINPDIDVPPTHRDVYGGTPYGYGSGATPHGLEWTVTEDQIIPAGTRMRYLVRLQPQIIFVGGAGSPSAAFPILECDDEIVYKDPDTGLYPPFVMPAAAAANDGTPIQNLASDFHSFSLAFPGPFYPSTLPGVNAAGNGNSNVISVRETLSAFAHIEYKSQNPVLPLCDCAGTVFLIPGDVVEINGTFGSLVKATTGHHRVDLGTPNCYTTGGGPCVPWTSFLQEVGQSTIIYAVSTGGALLSASLVSAQPNPYGELPSTAFWEVKWRHWLADWY